MAEIIQWIDLIWLPIALIITRRRQWPVVVSFFACCILMLRLQVELMSSMGYPNGILPLLQAPALTRGLITYSVFYALYLALVHYSPGSRKYILLAASITIFFAALFTSMIVMLL